MTILSNNLYKVNKTILTNKDLALIWQENDYNRLKSKISYYTKKGVLIRLTRGVYAKDEKFSARELATSIYAPSYLSFESVLKKEGIIFQYSDTITVASKWPRKININNISIQFRKLKDSILFNTNGIIFQDNYSMATKERAFLDMIYLYPNYYFDNLSNIDWDVCFELVKIYSNKQLIKRLNRYYKKYARQS